TASGATTKILKEQQPPAVHISSPSTQDTGLCHGTSSARFLSHSSRSSHSIRKRKLFVFILRLHPSTSLASEKSLVLTQDPERSLTEYIHHLEVIQQRLEGVQAGK
ncbi:PCNT protein, partial [Galbula dea]|nr:PCNT protein [Galbula dea]